MAQEKQHSLFFRIILCCKETLAGIVDLEVPATCSYELLKLGAVRSEGDATMYVQFKVGPHFFEGFLSGDFKYAPDQYKRPGRHAGNGGHIFTDGCLR